MGTPAFCTSVTLSQSHSIASTFVPKTTSVKPRDTRRGLASRKSFVIEKSPSQPSWTKKDSLGRTNVTSTLGFGFLSPRRGELSSNSGKLLPSSDARCACGSDKPYGKCCRPYHTAQYIPSDAEELLRSRYSAYAYRLPSYIMKTTHTSAIELDRGQWKREIMDFCKDYKFVGGVDIVEVQNPGPITTRILFR